MSIPGYWHGSHEWTNRAQSVTLQRSRSRAPERWKWFSWEPPVRNFPQHTRCRLSETLQSLSKTITGDGKLSVVAGIMQERFKMGAEKRRKLCLKLLALSMPTKKEK